MGLWGQRGIAEVSFDIYRGINVSTNSGGFADSFYPWGANGWHHVAIVGTGNELYIFLDGKFVTRSGEPINNHYGINKMPFNIGGNLLGANNDYFEGMIDDIYVYGRALNTKEIKKHIFSTEKILPDIKIVSPRTGSRYKFSNDPILFKTQVISNGAVISKVEFFGNDMIIGSVEKEPFIFSWEKYDAFDLLLP